MQGWVDFVGVRHQRQFKFSDCGCSILMLEIRDWLVQVHLSRLLPNAYKIPSGLKAKEMVQAPSNHAIHRYLGYHSATG